MALRQAAATLAKRTALAAAPQVRPGLRYLAADRAMGGRCGGQDLHLHATAARVEEVRSSPPTTKGKTVGDGGAWQWDRVLILSCCRGIRTGGARGSRVLPYDRGLQNNTWSSRQHGNTTASAPCHPHRADGPYKPTSAAKELLNQSEAAVDTRRTAHEARGSSSHIILILLTHHTSTF